MSEADAMAAARAAQAAQSRGPYVPFTPVAAAALGGNYDPLVAVQMLDARVRDLAKRLERAEAQHSGLEAGMTELVRQMADLLGLDTCSADGADWRYDE